MKQKGFTLIELSIVTSIIVVLLGFIAINLVRSQQKASLVSAREILLVDLKEQQIKAMSGETEGRIDPDSYGVYIDSNKYILFHGSAFDPSAPSNNIKNLDKNMRFNNPNYSIIFSRLNGEIASAMSIELEDISNSERILIHLNELGIVDQINYL